MTYENRIRVRYNTDFGCLEITVDGEEVVEAIFKLERISNVIVAARTLKHAESFWRRSGDGVQKLDNRVSTRPSRIALVLAWSYPMRITRKTLGEKAGVPLSELRKYITHRDYQAYFEEDETGIRLSPEGVVWASRIIQNLQARLKEEEDGQ